MNTLNYDKRMQALIDSLPKGAAKPGLLLHCCCAPCSSAVLEKLSEAFDITVYFYNPNIDTADEHALRERELQTWTRTRHGRADFVAVPYDPAVYMQAVRGLEDEPEGGERCARCFALRLRAAAQYAAAHGFDFFTTTLTISPMKSASLLNHLGEAIAREVGTAFLPSDFKKRGGYQRSVDLSKAGGLYRQDYCGCVFSKRDARLRGAGNPTSG